VLIRDPGAASLLSRFLPDAGTVAVVLPAGVAFAVLAAALVGWLRVRRNIATPYTRKIFHFLIFTAAGVVDLLWGLGGVVVLATAAVAVVSYAVIRGDGFPFYEAMARPRDAPRRTLFIVVPMAMTALGGVLSNLLFPGWAFVGYLVCGWGDAAGEPVGTRWGRHRYAVPSMGGVPATRSLEGSAAVLLVGALAAGMGLLAAGSAPAHVVIIAVTAGTAGALVEAVSNHGLDNLTVQVAATAAAAVTAGFLYS
jgi:phytol kinase